VRKPILSIFPVLVTLLFSSVVFAQGKNDCDVLKEDDEAPKGLYGLCIAYYSADTGLGQERIRELYEMRAEGSGYPEIPPGTGRGNSAPCPCWTLDTLALAPTLGDPQKCGTNVNDGITDPATTSYDFAEYGYIVDAPTVKLQAGGLFGGAAHACHSAVGFQVALEVVGFNDVTAEHIQTCRDEIHALEEDFVEFGIDCTFED